MAPASGGRAYQRLHLQADREQGQRSAPLALQFWWTQTGWSSGDLGTHNRCTAVGMCSVLLWARFAVSLNGLAPKWWA